MKNKIVRFLAIAGLAGIAVIPAKADLNYQLDYIFSGVTPLGGTGPTATFSDVAGGVQLTMSGGGLVGTEFLGAWYFNFNPSLNAASLNFANTGSSGINPTLVTISQSADAFKADGDGFFDILFDLPTAGADRFEAGDSLTYLITGIPGLTANDFNATSVNGPVNGFYTAAHLQALANGQSDWIADQDGGGRDTGGPVPEPSTYLVLGSFIGLAVCLKRRIESAARLAVA